MWGEALKKLHTGLVETVAMQLWPIDPNTLMLCHDGINVVYECTIQHEVCFLRVTHPSVRSYEQVSAVFDFLAHVSNYGASVCHPIASLNQQWVEQAEIADDHYLLNMLRGIDARKMDQVTLSPIILKAWGESLAGLHKAASTYTPPNPQIFSSSIQTWEETRGRLEVFDEPLTEVFYQLDAWFQALDPTDSKTFGLVHADYRLGNILYDGEQVHTIDFDEPAYGWWVMDIARCFVDYSDLPAKERLTRLDSFLMGYRNIWPMPEILVQDLAKFMQIKDLEMYSWTKKCWGRETTPDDNKTEDVLRIIYNRILNPVQWYQE